MEITIFSCKGYIVKTDLHTFTSTEKLKTKSFFAALFSVRSLLN